MNFLISLLLQLLYLSLFWSFINSSLVDVCILGGGSSGMAASVFLKDNGYSVLILEKATQTGGHCNTQYFPVPNPSIPNWIELGVLQFQNTTFLNSMKYGNWSLDSCAYVERFVPAPALIPTSTVYPSNNYGARLGDGMSYGRLDAEIPSFDYYVAFYTLLEIVVQYPWLEDGSYPSVIPQELLVPFSDFILKHNLQPLVPNLFNSLLFTGGLPDYRDLLTFYALQTLNQGILSFFTSNSSGFYIHNGCRSLYNGIERYIGLHNILLNVTLTKVVRSATGKKLNRVFYQQYNTKSNKVQKYSVSCKNIVVAFNPTANNLKPFKLSREEQDLFNGIEFSDYFNFGINIQGALTSSAFNLFNLNLSNINPVNYSYPDRPCITMLIKDYSYSNYAHGYYVSKSGNKRDATREIQRQLNNIPKCMLSKSVINEYYYHEYQCHFCKDLLNSSVYSVSPYQRLDKIQGQLHTFYVGATYSFANSVLIWEHTFRLITKHFKVQ